MKPLEAHLRDGTYRHDRHAALLGIEWDGPPRIDVVRACEMRESGSTLQEIADELGHSVTGVWHALERAGVPRRKKQPLHDPAEIATCYAAGATIRDIADAYGLASSAVLRYLERAGQSRRHPGRERLSPARETRIPNRVRDLVLERDGHTCRSCGKGPDAFRESHWIGDMLTMDHVVPRSRGGGDGADNLQVLCFSCNSSKGAD